MKRILSLSLTVFALFLLSCTNKAIPTPKFIGWEPLDYVKGGGLGLTAKSQLHAINGLKAESRARIWLIFFR